MDLVARLLAATLVADLGAGLGTAMGAVAPRRLEVLIWIAAGAMLAVTAFDVLPEAYHAAGWWFVPAALSGWLLLLFVSRELFDVCPSCAIAELSEGDRLRGRYGVPLMLGALGLHSLLDGLGVAAQNIGHRDLGLLLAISLHKLPEGLALTLLLIGAGRPRIQALLWAIGVELLTLAGGLLGRWALGMVDPRWPALVAAHVAGGFLFLIWSTVRTPGDKPGARTTLALIGGLSFVVVSIFLLAVGA